MTSRSEKTPAKRAAPKGTTPKMATPKGTTPKMATPKGTTPKGVTPKGVTADTDDTPFFEDAVLERAIGMDSAEIGEDTVVVDSLHGRALRINSTGTVIWRQLANQSTFAELVRLLTDNFPVQPNDAKEVLTSYLSDLLDRGLIGASNASRFTSVQRNT